MEKCPMKVKENFICNKYLLIQNFIFPTRGWGIYYNTLKSLVVTHEAIF